MNEIDENINIALLVEYDGTNYSGWQCQKNANSIQDALQDAIFNLTGEKVKLFGCSRTDAGVHAIGHVSNFMIKTKIPIEKFPLALNAYLPKDIAVKSAKIVDKEFNARFSSVGKIYKYNLWNEPTRTAINHKYTYHVPQNLDINAMICAANELVGTHDFATFMATGSQVKSTIRTLYSIDVVKIDNMISMIYHGDGFLYNMVRILSGTILYAGMGKINPFDIKDIILSKNRKRAGKTLPANGLVLEKVFYNPSIFE